MKITLCKHYAKKEKLTAKLHEAYPKLKIQFSSCIGLCKYCKDDPTAKYKGKKLHTQKIKRLVEAL